MKKKTLLDFRKMKQTGEKLAWITAYDFPTGTIAQSAGIDMILVGDSGGMVQLGYDNTIPVTMDQMIVMSSSVRRGAKSTFVVGDMPMGSYEISTKKAVKSALRFVKEGGCDAIKLEGGKRVVPQVKAIVDSGILTIGHLGLTPQSVNSFGGYRVQGKSLESFEAIMEDAKALEAVGIFSLLLESMPAEPAEQIAKELKIPVYSIGAGNKVDGQLIIIHDLLGFYPIFRPKFAKCFVPDVLGEYLKDLKDNMNNMTMNLRDGFSELGERSIRKYISDVKNKNYPSDEFIYKIKEDELNNLKKSKYWNEQ